MNAIAARIGEERARVLSERVGGMRLYVPGSTQTGRANALAALVGEELAVVLIIHFAEQRLYVPVRHLPANVDRGTVMTLTEKGWSANRIARFLGCSDRTIYNHRRKSAPLDYSNP